MSKNFKFFSIKFTAIRTFNCFFGVLFFFKLHKAVSTTCTIVVALELTLDDWAKAREKLVNLLLSGLAAEILNVEIGFGIRVVLELQTDCNHFSVQFEVI